LNWRLAPLSSGKGSDIRSLLELFALATRCFTPSPRARRQYPLKNCSNGADQPSGATSFVNAVISNYEKKFDVDR